MWAPCVETAENCLQRVLKVLNFSVFVSVGNIGQSLLRSTAAAIAGEAVIVGFIVCILMVPAGRA